MVSGELVSEWLPCPLGGQLNSSSHGASSIHVPSHGLLLTNPQMFFSVLNMEGIPILYLAWPVISSASSLLSSLEVCLDTITVSLWSAISWQVTAVAGAILSSLCSTLLTLSHTTLLDLLSEECMKLFPFEFYHICCNGLGLSGCQLHLAFCCRSLFLFIIMDFVCHVFKESISPHLPYTTADSYLLYKNLEG